MTNNFIDQKLRVGKLYMCKRDFSLQKRTKFGRYTFYKLTKGTIVLYCGQTIPGVHYNHQQDQVLAPDGVLLYYDCGSGVAKAALVGYFEEINKT